MQMLRKGRYVARIAETPDDLRRAQHLRWIAFVAARGLVHDNGSPAPGGAGADSRPRSPAAPQADARACDPLHRDTTAPEVADHDHGPQTDPDIDISCQDALDTDRFDALCRHVLIEEARSGALVACYRLLPLACGADIGRSYSAQYYNLDLLRSFDGPMLEMGRFCLHPAWTDPDIMRLAWGALSRFVDAERAEMLFGCSSFMGTEPDSYLDAFAMLKDRHLAPRRWLPRVKAPNVFRFARALRLRTPDARLAMLRMPPLLRSYLAMGGWVSDHAVVDRDLNTLHVFTGLEIRAIPPARARLLRALAG